MRCGRIWVRSELDYLRRGGALPGGLIFGQVRRFCPDAIPFNYSAPFLKSPHRIANGTVWR